MKLIILILVLFLFSCKHFYKNEQIVSRIKVSFKMPIQIKEGISYGDTINIYACYFKNYTIFELPHHETLQNEKALLYDSVKYDYLIYNNSSKNGFLLKNINDGFINEINVDSILKIQAFYGGNGNVINILDKETKSVKMVSSFNGKEVYRYITNNVDIYDSMYVICDKKMIDIKFSFSSRIDSLYNSKFNEFIMFLKYDTLSNKNKKDFFTNRLEVVKDYNFDREKIRNLFLRFINYEN